MPHITSTEKSPQLVDNHPNGSAMAAPSGTEAPLPDSAQSVGNQLKETVQGALDYVQQTVSAVAQTVVSESNGQKTTVGDLAAQALAGSQAAASQVLATGVQVGSGAWGVLQEQGPVVGNALLATGVQVGSGAWGVLQEKGPVVGNALLAGVHSGLDYAQQIVSTAAPVVVKETVQGALDYAQQTVSAVAQTVVRESNGQKTTVGDLAAQALAGGQEVASQVLAGVHSCLDYAQQTVSAVAQTVVRESNGQKTTVGDLAAQALAGGQAAASQVLATGVQVGSGAWGVLQEKGPVVGNALLATGVQVGSGAWGAWGVLEEQGPVVGNALLAGISSMGSALDWLKEVGAPADSTFAGGLLQDDEEWGGFNLLDAATMGLQEELYVSTQEGVGHSMLVAQNDDLSVWMNGTLA